MGNANGRESRHGGSLEYGQASPAQASRGGATRASRGSRSGRPDLGGLLTLTGSQSHSGTGQPERRETRQEREARRLERERQARLIERERSMREEHVDGGYLVTLGTYVGPEDFNKSVVRQLQIERRLAPFWRGLQDFSDTWTEYQLTAAVRGLDIPPPDQPPPDGFFSRPPLSTTPSSPPKSSQGQYPGNTLTVPHGNQAGATTSPPAMSLSTSPATRPLSIAPFAGNYSPGGAPSPSPTGGSAIRGSSSPFKPRAKALAAALSVSSRNGSSTDIVPRELQLSHDPYVNGQPIEVFLYKNATECPICFLSYPPYLNHTRCCDQAICSECFVQIKRADPHYPEGHGDHSGSPNPDLHPEEQAGQLISEPSCCPYCQQPEFGVTYEPPPFRRGLVYSSGTLTSGIGAMGAAMSSNSSINSAMSPTSQTGPTIGSPPTAGSGGTTTPASRRRTQSLSANAPNVVTTDRVRPDWATKLATQRAHIARRAAAATALHTAAFLMGNQDNRAFRVGRFSRRNTSTTNFETEASPSQGLGEGGDASSTMEPGPRSSSGRGLTGLAGMRHTSRMEDLEELMFREALRQSLASEEERRRKEEKEERKETKRREKEERKAAKAAAKRQGGSSSSLYTTGGGGGGTDSGHSSASASSLSLSGLSSSLGLGSGGGGAGSSSSNNNAASGSSRRRGNSGASNLRVEASVANAMAVSSAMAGMSAGGSGTGSAASANGSGGTSPVTGNNSAAAAGLPSGSTATTGTAPNGGGKGKGVDRGLAPTPETDSDTEPGASAASATAAATSAPRLIPTSQPSAGPSHLRQMSSASSVCSSLPDSPVGSFPNALHLQDPRASGLSLGSRSAASDDADHADDHDPSTSTEPMFNFTSLAAVVGVQIEGKNAGRRLSAIAQDDEVPGQMEAVSAKEAEATAVHAENPAVEYAEHADEPGKGPAEEPSKEPTLAAKTTVVTEETLDEESAEAATDASSNAKPDGPTTNSGNLKTTPEVVVIPGTPAPTDGFD